MPYQTLLEPLITILGNIVTVKKKWPVDIQTLPENAETPTLSIS